MKAKLLIGYVLLGLSVGAVSCVVTTEKPADSVPPPAPPPPPPPTAPTTAPTPAPTATTPPPAPTPTTTASVPPPVPPRSEFKSPKPKGAAAVDGGTTDASTTSDGGS